MKKFSEFKTLNTEKYDAYYAMVDAKKMAKKKGGKPEDYIDAMMKKRGYKKDTYSGHGVWKWIKEETVNEGQLEINFKKFARSEKKKLIKLLNSLEVKRKFNLKTVTSPMLDRSVTVKAYYLDLDDLRDYLKDKGYKWKDGKMWAGKPMDITMESISEDVKEGTMKSGIFDSDVRKRKDAARKLVFFLKAKRNQKIGPMDDNTGSNKAIEAYIKELMKYVFDDEMIDNLYPTGKNVNVKANDIVVKRLKKMGVKVK